MDVGLQLLAIRRMASFAARVVRDDRPEYDYLKRRWWYHLAICEALDDLLRYHEFKGQRGGIARLSVSMPPQHGKSLHGSELFPAKVLGHLPDARIMLGTYSGDFAKRAITNTRGFMNGPAYSSIFSTRVGSVKQIEAGNSKQTTVAVTDTASYFETLRPREADNLSAGYEPARGSFIAQGMKGQITGRGYDVGIIDDLIKHAAEAMSPAHNQAMWRFYVSCFDTRGSPHAVQLYIATRWTSPDFANELADYWRSEKHLVRELRFAAIAEQADLDEGDPRELGETLDNPSYRSRDWYYNKRSAVLTQEPWVWAGLYQQRPNSGGAALFAPDRWRFYDETFDFDSMQRMFACVDFSVDAAMTESGASFTVIQVTAVVHRNDYENWFLLEEARGHWDDTAFVQRFVDLHAKWAEVFREKVSNGKVWVESKALGPILMSRLKSGDYNFMPVPKATSKIACHRLAATETREGRYWLPRGQWGSDPTSPGEPLFGCVEVGSVKEKGSFIYELAASTKPDDRRDTLAQQVICTSRYLGIDLLAVRA